MSTPLQKPARKGRQTNKRRSTQQRPHSINEPCTLTMTENSWTEGVLPVEPESTEPRAKACNQRSLRKSRKSQPGSKRPTTSKTDRADTSTQPIAMRTRTMQQSSLSPSTTEACLDVEKKTPLDTAGKVMVSRWLKKPQGWVEIKSYRDAQESTGAVKTEHGVEYQVESILGVDFLGKDGAKRYRIKWLGWAEPTYEPRENLGNCQEMLEAFEREQEKTAEAKRKRDAESLPEFVVKRVVDVRTTENGWKEYLIEWEGSDTEQTWEPVHHLQCDGLITKFHKQRDASKKKHGAMDTTPDANTRTRKDRKNREKTRAAPPSSLGVSTDTMRKTRSQTRRH